VVGSNRVMLAVSHVVLPCARLLELKSRILEQHGNFMWCPVFALEI